MKMYHYTSKSGGNFGDELNVWMWPQLIPHAFDGRDEAIFLGIGSILFDHFPSDQKKVVMGAGYAGYSGVPIIDLSWKVYFLRGKLTARALGVDERLGIGDAAILLRSCKLPSPKKRFKVSFMPHWESLPRGNWQEVCNRADVQLIDPRSDVDTVLEQLLASERVVTEAMHGAIVCDALRIPWIAIEPVLPIHRMKWYDWASALDLELRPLTLVGSTAYEWALARTQASSRWNWRVERFGMPLKHIREPFSGQAAKRLRFLAQQPTCLSEERAIQNAHEQMLLKLDQFRCDFRQERAL